MNRMSVAEAARTLKVSPQAIHGRIKRDTIQHETGEEGMIYVFLTDEELGSTSVDNPVENSLENPVVNAYIAALKSEIETLKTHTQSLETDREEWKEEARRKDTIIAQMNQTLQSTISRIPELESPEETRESTLRDSDGEGRGKAPTDTQDSSESLSWWRRLFR